MQVWGQRRWNSHSHWNVADICIQPATHKSGLTYSAWIVAKFPEGLYVEESMS